MQGYALSEAEYAGPVVSAAVIYGGAVLLGLLLAYCVGAYLHWRRRARVADDAVSERARELREGEGVVVGTVEYEEGADLAVRVEVEQKGEESESSGTWSHTWTETRRRIAVRPFHLRTRDGTRVRVEPTRDVQLADHLDGVISVRTNQRIRVAQLTPGETVIAVGRLVRQAIPGEPGAGYRDAPMGWVMGPPRVGPMVLSTLPLGTRLKRKAAGRALNAVVLGLGILAAHLPLAGFHLRTFEGERAVGTITQRWISVTTDDDGDSFDHYHVNVQLDSGEAISGEVLRADFLAAPQPVLALSVPGHHWASQLEPDASAHGLLVGLSGALTFGMLLMVLFTDPKPWWEKQVVDLGSGRLPVAGSLPR